MIRRVSALSIHRYANRLGLSSEGDPQRTVKLSGSSISKLFARSGKE